MRVAQAVKDEIRAPTWPAYEASKPFPGWTPTTNRSLCQRARKTRHLRNLRRAGRVSLGFLPKYHRYLLPSGWTDGHTTT
jgi:hypothetical protein